MKPQEPDTKTPAKPRLRRSPHGAERLKPERVQLEANASLSPPKPCGTSPGVTERDGARRTDTKRYGTRRSAAEADRGLPKDAKAYRGRRHRTDGS